MLVFQQYLLSLTSTSRGGLLKISLGPGYRVKVSLDLCHCTMHFCIYRFESVEKEVDDAGNLKVEYARLETMGCTTFKAELPSGVPKVDYVDEDHMEYYDVAEDDFEQWLRARLRKQAERSYTANELEQPRNQDQIEAKVEVFTRQLMSDLELVRLGQPVAGVSIARTPGGTLLIGFG